jgi:hypothetical protein
MNDQRRTKRTLGGAAALLLLTVSGAALAGQQYEDEAWGGQGGYGLEDSEPYGMPNPYAGEDPYAYDQNGSQQPGYPGQQGGFGQQQNPGPLPTMADVPQGRLAMMDVNGFGQPVPAYHFERPEGFRIDEAVIAWSQQPCTGMMPMERLRLSGPNGQLIRSGGLEGWVNGVDRLRSMFMQQGMPMPAQMQNCPDRPLMNAAQYLQQVAQRTRPGARITSQRARPDIVRHAYQELERDRAYMTQQAQQAISQARIEAAELVLTYDGPNGPVEEVMLTALGTVGIPQTPFPVTAQFVSGVMSVSAPKGQLDKEVLDRVWRSAQPIPAYQRHQLQKDLQLERAQANEMAQFRRQAEARYAANKRQRQSGRFYNVQAGAAGGTSVGNAVRANSWDAFNNRMNAQDRISADTTDTMMGTTTVYNPFAGHDIAVEGTDMDVWQTPGGDLISRPQDQYYNPADDGIDATKLESVASGGGGDFWGDAITN